MWREETVEEISDGKLYTANDLVKIGTGDCRGCCDCCRMGPVIVLDPLDVFELNRFLGQSFEELLDETIELKVIDGLILPVLKLVPADSDRLPMDPESSQPGLAARQKSPGTRVQEEPLDPQAREKDQKQSAQEENMVCPYLGEDGRCSIHACRPGICRLYPLGRSWEGDEFHYILQVHECSHCTGEKIKVKKWLGIPALPAYEDFCRSWHAVLSSVRRVLEGSDPEGKLRRQICVYLLKQFFLCDWNVDDFYETFGKRRQDAMRYLGFAS